MRTYYQGETIEVFLNSTETLSLELCEDFALYFVIGEGESLAKVEKAQMDSLADGSYRAKLDASVTSELPIGVYDVECKFKVDDAVHVSRTEKAFTLKPAASRYDML